MQIKRSQLLFCLILIPAVTLLGCRQETGKGSTRVHRGGGGAGKAAGAGNNNQKLNLGHSTQGVLSSNSYSRNDKGETTSLEGQECGFEILPSGSDSLLVLTVGRGKNRFKIKTADAQNHFKALKPIQKPIGLVDSQTSKYSAGSLEAWTGQRIDAATRNVTEKKSGYGIEFYTISRKDGAALNDEDRKVVKNMLRESEIEVNRDLSESHQIFDTAYTLEIKNKRFVGLTVVIEKLGSESADSESRILEGECIFEEKSKSNDSDSSSEVPPA
ncbi:MAG: hypothetical protein ACK5Y2_08185 [Bdellovibrionales bacterium]